jgi:hypothetical protein
MIMVVLALGLVRVHLCDPFIPVAPLPDNDPIARLRAAGDLREAQGHLNDLPEPLKVPRGMESPSSVLARLRRDER